MNRESVEAYVRDILTRADFEQSPTYVKSVVFDIIGRRDDLTLIIKILLNIDTLKEEFASGMKTLSSTLSASPLLIGLKSGSYPLDPGVIYMRHGIPALNPHTLAEYLLEEIPPMVFTAPGGYYVKIDGRKLRKLREERGVSLGTLARIAGVSRRAIQMYESGDICASVDIAMRLEEFFDEPLAVPLNPFHYDEKTAEECEPKSGIEREIYENLSRIGYEVHYLVKCPFEAVANDRKRKVYLTGIERGNENLKMKARIVREISRVTYTDSFIVVQREINRKRIEDTPIVTLRELRSMRNAYELRKLLEEREN